MTTKILTLDQLLLACAGATVPCPVCDLECQREVPCMCVEIKHLDKVACDGSGRIFFFGASMRLPCPCLKHADGCGMCWAQGNRHDDHCEPCQGRGWIPNADSYAWRQAIREKGWVMVTTTSSKRDDIRMFPSYKDYYRYRYTPWFSAPVVSVIVYEKGGLRDQMAEMEVIRQMLAREPGVGMPNG